MMTKTDLDLAADIIDMRDIIARFEELDGIKDNHGGSFNEPLTPNMASEWKRLRAILSDLKGNGGDEQWRGDRYPVTLIRDSYFTDYAREMLFDCGELPCGIPDYIAIDWQATALNIRVDYSPVEIHGVTYWTR